MTKLDNSEEISNYIKKYNLLHFKKVNLIGTSNVGKKTLISYIEHFSDKNIDFEIKEKIQENEIEINNTLVELIKKLSIPYNESDKLNINLYITNIENNIDFVKDNLDTLFNFSECIIFMIDITNANSFSSISELIPLIYGKMKENIEYGDIPIFLISNKLDLETNREVSGFEIKELIDHYNNISNYEISLKLEKNAKDENINEFILKLCNVISEKSKKYSFKYDPLNLVKIKEPMSISKDSKIIEDTVNTLNFMLLGTQTVGKTSFAQRLFNNNFSENTLATLGVDVLSTIVELYGHLVKIDLLDTAGQERFKSIPKKYYSKGDGFFLLFDVCDKKSFDDISEWIKDIRETRFSDNEKDFEKKSNDEVLVLIGNKIDKVNERIIKKEDAINLAKKYNVKYYEMSCKQGINVYEIFCDVIFDTSSINRRESTNFVIQRRKTKLQDLFKPKKKLKICCL